MAPAGIRLDRISRRIGRRARGAEDYAVRALSLDVAEGELVSLLGAAGSGKSTTLRLIAGLDRPDEGRILISGRDVTRLAPGERGVAFGTAAGGQASAAVALASLMRAARGALRLPPDQPPSDPHAAGERLQAALAQAVVRRPKVLLLDGLFDGPLGALDARLRGEMREQIRALQKRTGITTVHATRDHEEAMAIADRIVLMDQGLVVQDGSAQDLYFRPDSEFVARFVGHANLLTARVLSDAEVEFAGQRLAFATGFPPGALARLVIRPEMIELDAAAGSGRIVQRTFLGERTDYEVSLGDETLTVSTTDPLRKPLDVGQPVTVRFRPEGIHVLP